MTDYDAMDAMSAYAAYDKATEEIERLRTALKQIAALGGNLDDKRIESIGGINEGRSRALMYSYARKIAREALLPASARAGEEL